MRTLSITFFALLVAAPLVAHSANAEPVGRLFFTPDQRAVLDKLRAKGVKGASVEAPPAAAASLPEQPPEPEPPPAPITLDGYVRRSSGKSTTWINQVPHNEQEVSLGIRVRQLLSRPPAISIVLPSGKRVNLKAGQTFDRTTGKVSEVYDPAPPQPEPLPK